MKLLHFSGGPTPTEGLPISLMSELFAAAGKWKKNATMADLRFGVAVVPGSAPETAALPHFPVKRNLAVLFERGEQIRLQVSQDVLHLGMSLMGFWVWAWNAPISIDDRPAEKSVPGWSDAISWLCSGERGSSSEAMCRALYGLPESEGSDQFPFPKDPDDLRRCRGFLNAVPDARARLSELSVLSPTWKVYVEHWDQMNRLFDEEAPLGQLMKTSALMRSLQGRGE